MAKAVVHGPAASQGFFGNGGRYSGVPGTTPRISRRERPGSLRANRRKKATPRRTRTRLRRGTGVNRDDGIPVPEVLVRGRAWWASARATGHWRYVRAEAGQAAVGIILGARDNFRRPRCWAPLRLEA